MRGEKYINFYNEYVELYRFLRDNNKLVRERNKLTELCHEFGGEPELNELVIKIWGDITNKDENGERIIKGFINKEAFPLLIQDVKFNLLKEKTH